MSFYDVIAKYSSYHNTSGTDKTTLHSYGETYDAIIETLKTKQNVSVLEIGIYSGAFLQVLCECLPTAAVYGIDIDLSHLRFPESRAVIQRMDGTAADTPSRLGQKFDLIIEDGSHTPSDQVKTLEVFAPYLKQGGVFVVEDIQPEHEVALRSDLQRVATKHGLSMEWRDLRSVKNRRDDILAVLTRHH